jgi:hypothetical protein
MIPCDPVVTDCCIVSSLAAIQRHNATSRGTRSDAQTARIGQDDESATILVTGAVAEPYGMGGGF